MALLNKPLTAKQSMIWSMKESGKTRAEIANELGISIPVVTKTCGVIRKKLGLTPENRGGSQKAMGTALGVKGETPVLEPGQIEHAVDEVNQTMKRVGLPERIREGLVRRLKVKHGGVESPVKPITDEELKRSHREKLSLIHSYMDDKVVSEASLRDLATASAQLTEKLQLLEGKPTQIMSDLERKSLLELMPFLIAEAQRRGVTYDGKVTEKVVSPA